MGKEIRIRVEGIGGLASDRFLMILDLDELPRQTIAKTRQIFRLMCRNDHLNEAAIQTTEEWLQELVSITRFVLEQTQMENQQERVNTSPNSRRPEDVAARRRNKKLEDAEKAAQRDYNRAIKLQHCFIQERNY